jgi:hypothetical protein
MQRAVFLTPSRITILRREPTGKIYHDRNIGCDLMLTARKRQAAVFLIGRLAVRAFFDAAVAAHKQYLNA